MKIKTFMKILVAVLLLFLALPETAQGGGRTV